MRTALPRFLALGLAAVVSAPAFAADEFVAVKGQVVWSKAIAELVGYKPEITTDKPVCCKDGDLVSNKFEVDPKTKALKNVIVWLRPDSDDRMAKFPQDKIAPAIAKAKSVQHVIDQPKCQFEPRVLAAREGDTLVVKNSASIGHNVNFKDAADTETDSRSFNVTIPAGKEHVIKEPLRAARTPTMFNCDIHRWMEGRLRVFDHPYFAVTDKDGNFEIKEAPVGKWRVVYFHEGGFHKGRDGALGFPIEIKGDKKTTELEKIDYEMPKQGN